MSENRVVHSGNFYRLPTEEDVAVARNAIAQHEKSIAEIDKEIEVLFHGIHRLRRKKCEHEEIIVNCKGIITLAIRLPPELLATIFEYCVKDGWVRGPFVLSSVCSVWRAAASFPFIWSRVYVNCDSLDPLARTRFWLSKARSTPLHITLTLNTETAQLPPIVDLLLDSVAQWRVFSLVCNPLNSINYILSRCVLPAPQLQEVHVKVGSEPSDANENQSLAGFRSAFRQAPRFTTLNISFHTVPPKDFFPPSITELYIELPNPRMMSASLSGASLIDLLQGLPLLQKFSLTFPYLQQREYIPEPDDTRVVSVPHLEALALIVSPDVNRFLRHIDAPALRRLYLRSSDDPLGFPHTFTGNSLRQFIERVSPPLELLELHDIDLVHEDFASCFESLRTLKELRLHETEISDRVLRLLDGPDGLCPRLKRLDVRWCGQLSGRALVELVRSRLTAVTESGQTDVADKLEEVAVINCCFVEEQDIVDLATSTICRVVMRETDDYCRFKGCCNNERYRQRLRLRHLMNQSLEQRARMRLIVS